MSKAKKLIESVVSGSGLQGAQSLNLTREWYQWFRSASQRDSTVYYEMADQLEDFLNNVLSRKFGVRINRLDVTVNDRTFLRLQPNKSNIVVNAAFVFNNMGIGYNGFAKCTVSTELKQRDLTNPNSLCVHIRIVKLEVSFKEN